MTSKSLLNDLSNWIFLTFIVGIPLFAMIKKIDIFSSFLQGAKDSFSITLKITPPIIAILVAIGMFRAAGGFTVLESLLSPLLNKIGFPSALLPLVVVRPFSGSASNGMLAELAHVFGGNSQIAHMAAIMMGSTETTFYVIAVYFGSLAIRRTRYAIPVGLFADFIGIAASVIIVKII